MKGLETEEIKHFYDLNNNMQFQFFKDWLYESLSEERERSDRLDEFGDMKVSQGYRRAIGDILDTLENIKSELEQIKSN